MTRPPAASEAEPVPFVDLRSQLAPLREEILGALGDVMDTAGFAQGPATGVFERAFAAYCGTAHCRSCNSGTSALHLAIRALEIGPGDEVITVPMTFVATAWPLLYEGIRPVLIDVDPKRYTMDTTLLEGAITSKTKAIVPVHLYGQCAEMDPILEIASAHGIPVIEDAAQAHGAEYQGRRAGSMGTLGCFSFYPGKNLGACGEGGAVVTDDPELADRIGMLRDNGQREKYEHVEIGYNYRMDGFQGAVLDVKLKHLERWTRARGAVARKYDERLADAKVSTPAPCPDGRHVYHLYVVRHEQRDALRSHLADQGIDTGLHYPTPLHLQPPFAHLGHREGDFPVSEEIARSGLSLPMFAEITDAQVARVVSGVRSLGG